MLTVLIVIGACSADTPRRTGTYAEARERMVAGQIAARGITDKRVLQAMRTVERHRFVPEELRSLAYADHPLPIGEDQTISQPYIVALMTELVKPDSSDKVLEIGTGSGYQAAILGELVDSVFSIEIICTLAERAASLLDSLDYDNVTVKCGDGYAGWEEHAPFDAVIVTAAPPHVPQPLVDQLKAGGRMVVPVGVGWQELMLIEKDSTGVRQSSIIPVRFVPMTGEGVKGGE